MQATGELVVFIREFATGVKGRENHLDTGDALLWVNVHGHTAAIVTDRQGTVFMQGHINATGMSS